jgi:SAM-dependent methyltransferase
LIDNWQLGECEVGYINRQQGMQCNTCGSNIRSIALANAIKSYFGTYECLSEFCGDKNYSEISILEINEAGNISKYLKQFDKYQYAKYPEVDMHAMPYEDKSFDMVIHSDTLEHIKNPIHGLVECYRVLKAGGALCFTVPIIVNRMSRDRSGLPKSYHGNPKNTQDDFIVHTEFGADTWTYLLKAGFTELTIHTFNYPSGIAFSARRHKA